MPGSGLGLSIVRQAADRHSGSSRRGGPPAGGARLVLRLPGSSTPPTDLAATARGRAPGRRGRRAGRPLEVCDARETRSPAVAPTHAERGQPVPHGDDAETGHLHADQHRHHGRRCEPRCGRGGPRSPPRRPGEQTRAAAAPADTSTIDHHG